MNRKLRTVPITAVVVLAVMMALWPISADLVAIFDKNVDFTCLAFQQSDQDSARQSPHPVGDSSARELQAKDSDYLLLALPSLVSRKYIVFTTEGSSFAPVITVSGSPTILWVWADGSTSDSTAPVKNYGSVARRVNKLYVNPWSALRRINIGYDGGDGGSGDIEHVADQQVSSVQGLHLVAPYLAQWCSSYNQITSLDFSNFTNLDTIECYLSQSMRNVNLWNTPKLKRACFEDCNLQALDLSGSPNLEDLRGALNDFPTINFGSIGAKVWHICVRDNPQLTDRTIFADMTPFPNLTEFFIWNDNQTGALRIPATHPTSTVSILADGNQYTSLDLSGALANSASYAEVIFRNNSLSSINITGCSQITRLYLQNNSFDAGSLDTLLATLDALGRNESDGGTGGLLWVDLRGNATPGSTGYDHAVNLGAKGWTVMAEGWTVEPLEPSNGEQRIDFSTSGDQTVMRCDFGRAGTTAVWHWSDGTTTGAVSGECVTKTGLGAGAHDHYLMISDGAALTRFGACDGGGAGHLTAMPGFENFPSMRILYAYNEDGLTSLGRTNVTRMREYHLLGTALSALALDQVFADAVASNVAGGTIWSASGTAASEADRAVLLARGWSLYN
ncbi:MAG: hypothetical protein AB9866_08210 [Syntrophobacteraceae bacterium]